MEAKLQKRVEELEAFVQELAEKYARQSAAMTQGVIAGRIAPKWVEKPPMPGLYVVCQGDSGYWILSFDSEDVFHLGNAEVRNKPIMYYGPIPALPRQ